MSVKKLTGKWLVTAWVGLAVVLVAAVCVVFALVGRSVTTAQSTPGDSGAESDPAAVPQSVPKTIQPQSAGPANTAGAGIGGDDEASQQVDFVLASMWQAYSDPSTAVATDLSSILTESALEEFDAQAQEWNADGTRVSGTPRIENAHVTASDGTTATVRACVDSSGVTVTNEAGSSLTDDTSLLRALTDFSFVNDGGSWKLSGVSFPDDPTC
ncbi:hypothetical protein EHS14_01285 [Schaalia georgiae]|nr:hypothetical protein EHS14_01285 [Schaalia georgiae]